MTGIGAAAPLSDLIAPELDRPDEASVDLKPWREPIKRAMKNYGTDAIGGALVAAYTLGTHCRMDDVLPGGRLRRALDELIGGSH